MPKLKTTTQPASLPFRLPPPLQLVDRTLVQWRGRKFIYFGGCDYHRLASHQRICTAMANGLRRHGLNVAASRATTGNHMLYGQLERVLARFFDAPAAVLLSAGYVTNLAVAHALAGEVDVVLLDECSHGALAEAADRFGCPVRRFRHRDSEHLGKLVSTLPKSCRPILLTDGLFSHDGSVAPLRAYAKVLPDKALMLVDDAHGAGVLGAKGRGTPEHEGVPRERIIQTVTLSKAFGVYGGAVLASQSLANQLMSRSKAFTGATPLPLPLVCAALESSKLFRSSKDLLQRLRSNTAFVKKRLQAKNLSSAMTPGPVVSFVPENASAAMAMKRRLLRQEIFPTLIRYGNGPAHGYFRFAISSAHTRSQLEKLVVALTGF